MGQQRPHGASVFVGQRHSRYVLVTPLDHLVDPASAVRSLAGVVNDATRTVDQQRSEVTVTAFADA